MPLYAEGLQPWVRRALRGLWALKPHHKARTGPYAVCSTAATLAAPMALTIEIKPTDRTKPASGMAKSCAAQHTKAAKRMSLAMAVCCSLQRLSVVRCNGCLLFVATAVCCSLHRLSVVRCNGGRLSVATAVVYPLQALIFGAVCFGCRRCGPCHYTSAVATAVCCRLHAAVRNSCRVHGCNRTYNLHCCNVTTCMHRLQHAALRYNLLVAVATYSAQ
jgi:hypothetical protein